MHASSGRDVDVGMDLMLQMHGVKKASLAAFLRSEGFLSSRSIAAQPGCSYFYWFENQDEKSLAGVEASLTPGESEPELILAVHCKSWASWADVEKMNDVVRQARSKFGGQVDGDYGKNRYIPLWQDETSPLSRGVTRVYDHTLEVLGSLKYALPKNMIQAPASGLGDADVLRMFEYIQTQDPARVAFNGLIPMVVSVLEHYFLNVFLVLLQRDPAAAARLREKKFTRGLTGEELMRLADGSVQPAEIAAREYSFQNVTSLSAAFKDWFSVDLKNVLGPKRRVLKKTESLLEALSSLIEHRHDVVHRLALDRSLSRDDLLHRIALATRIIEEVTEAIGEKYDFPVERL